VCACGTPRDVEAQLSRLMPELTPITPCVAAWGDSAAPATLVVSALPHRDVRRKLASTNGIEHYHMAVRRRTAVVRVFPNEASFVRIASTLAMQRNEQSLSWRYFIPDVTHDLEVRMPAARSSRNPRSEVHTILHLTRLRNCGQVTVLVHSRDSTSSRRSPKGADLSVSPRPKRMQLSRQCALDSGQLCRSLSGPVGRSRHLACP
jgi:hypothetical protein